MFVRCPKKLNFTWDLIKNAKIHETVFFKNFKTFESLNKINNKTKH